MNLVLINIEQTLNQLINNQLSQLDPLNLLNKTFIVSTHVDEKVFLRCKNDIIIINMTHDSDLLSVLNNLSSKPYRRNHVIIIGTDTSYLFIRQLFRLGIYDYWIKPYQSHLINGSLHDLLRVTLENHNLLMYQSNIVESIKGDYKITRQELEVYYRQRIQHVKTDETLFQIMNTLLLELITPLSFGPMALVKAKVASLCATWILEQDNHFEALYKCIDFMRATYHDIFFPNVHSIIVKNAIYEVLAPSQHQKTVKYIADRLFQNQSHLSTTFKKFTGISLSEYIKRVKLYGSMWMLLDQEYRLDDILDILGYKDEQHFSRIFKEKTGLLPQSYRQLNKKYHLKK